MDWYSWLSRTGLEPSLVYKYALAFSGNELEREDLPYFNHEFLQSMGISVAKHRLEILKLAWKEVREAPNGLSKLVLAIIKTRECFNKYVNKLVHHDNNMTKKALQLPAPEPVSYKDKWREALCKNNKELKIEHPLQKTGTIAKSGPLDYRGQEKLLVTPRSLKLSGPLDRKLQERLVFSYKSPIISGSVDVAMAQERLMDTNRSPSPKVHGDSNKDKAGSGDLDEHTFWETLFQDMKPT
ncbi:Major facilitator superfamily protein isoform 1 [Hibiscus syriacus]|uniref:Major facilitator superfamily protein isoform 1 n=1 Tax=Hibiscus syriacus TaxID=106335 RepID=A0A6A3CEY8_HIBSY|nr:uncharacterized protein LOC120201338 [Hibiscus syriacus]KAE8726241.1 Major facilitator superfamily protein isoform 1 [Hibiscus syriacus]